MCIRDSNITANSIENNHQSFNIWALFNRYQLRNNMLIFSSLILRRHYQMPLYLANDSDNMDIACYFGQHQFAILLQVILSLIHI